MTAPPLRDFSVANLTVADLRLLRVFMTVAECGSFAAAQIELNLRQSTLSTQMATLEQRLGEKLCQRGRAGFELTEKGRIVYEACRRLFAGLGAFQEQIAGMRSRLVGELHVAVVDNVATNADNRLADAIDLFKRRDNEVQIRLEVLSPAEIERGVLEGRFHLGIAPFFQHVPGLEYTPLFREVQSLYCGARHPLFGAAGGDAPTVEAIREAAYVMRGYMAKTKLPQLPDFAPAATAVHMEAIAHFVLSGRYIGYLPEHYAAQWVANGQMRALRPDRLRYHSQFEVATLRQLPQPLVLSTFLQDLKEAHADVLPAESPGATRRRRKHA